MKRLLFLLILSPLLAGIFFTPTIVQADHTVEHCQQQYGNNADRVSECVAAIPPAQLNAPELDSLCDQQGASQTEFCQDRNPDQNPIVQYVGIAIQILSVIVGVASIIGIILGSFQLTVSGGDGQQVAKARRTIIYALVGLVVAIFAWSIVVFVLNRL